MIYQLRSSKVFHLAYLSCLSPGTTEREGVGPEAGKAARSLSAFVVRVHTASQVGIRGRGNRGILRGVESLITGARIWSSRGSASPTKRSFWLWLHPMHNELTSSNTSQASGSIFPSTQDFHPPISWVILRELLQNCFSFLTLNQL